MPSLARLVRVLLVCGLVVGRSHALSLPQAPSSVATKATPTECLPKQQQQLAPSWRERLDQILSKLQKPQQSLENHTYLTGNYAPVLDEHVQAPVQVVYGSIPSDLHGMLCRNGPNPILRRLTKKYHWFDGYAMLHNLRFEQGKAWYTNQFVPDNRFVVEQELDRTFFPTLGEYEGLIGLIKVLMHPQMVSERVPDLLTVLPMNTACIMFNDKFYCLNEASAPLECRILPDGRLERVGYEFFHGRLNYPISAHPKVDPHTGDLLFHSYSTNTEHVKRDGNIKYGRVSSQTGQIESYFVPTEEKHMTFAHNMLFTKDYSIVYDGSLHFDPSAMFVGGSYFRTKLDHELRFGIFPKDATSRDQVRWFGTGGPGTIVHPLNAWQEGTDDDTIVIWTPFCEDPDLGLDNADDLNFFCMKEYRLDLKTGKISEQVIDSSVNIEFCNVAVEGKFTRFGYAAIQDSSTPGEGSFAGFTVWDMERRKLHASVRYNANEAGGEIVVIPRPGRGEVYVGVYIHNSKEDTSFFHLYDGVTAELLCRLKMPYRVPYGFHGTWLSQKELDGHFAHHGGTNSVEEPVLV